MGEDEEGTLSALNAHLNELIEPCINANGGRLFKTTGDGLLAEFSSVIDAVRCAVAVQEGMVDRNAGISKGRQLVFRIGINVGDVIAQDGDVFGDGVNVAARIEGLAEPDGICISRSARDQIRDKLDYGLEDWGEVKVKNITRPIRVFRLLTAPEDAGKTIARPRGHLPTYRSKLAAAIAVLAMVGLGLLWLQPWRTTLEAASVANMAFSLPDKPSIAVLPFANLSDRTDQAFFADGMTDDIITDLSKISGLFVTAKHSTQGYKGQAANIRQIAEDLGVRYVLSGSVRRAGDKLRITAQLVDAIKGSNLWSERYDRKVEDVFAVQSEVTQNVVKAMEVTLKSREHDRVFQKYLNNIDAYDVWRQARAIVEIPSRENIVKGEELFLKTIELAPNFAGGHAGLSFNHSVKARFGYGQSREEEVKKAFKHARQAIALDPDFAWSHIALAGAYLANDEYDAAVDAMRQALVVQPGGYEVNLFMGFYLFRAGQSARAIEHLKIADNLGRVPTFRLLAFLGISYFMDGKYTESEATWKRTFDRFGLVKHNIPYVYLAASQFALGKLDDAAETVAQLKRINPDYRLSKSQTLTSFKSEQYKKHLRQLAVQAGIPE